MIEKDDFNFYDKNLWDFYITKQKDLCQSLKVAGIHPGLNQIIGLADTINANPIHGLRHPAENNSTGWFIWTGDYSSADDFFKPHHVGHLLEIKPYIIKYLGLPPGYRFLIDEKGYEDIWFDSSLLKV